MVPAPLVSVVVCTTLYLPRGVFWWSVPAWIWLLEGATAFSLADRLATVTGTMLTFEMLRLLEAVPMLSMRMA